jgi:hydrogenase-4 component H
MFKLHLISELKEAFINLKDKKAELPKPVKSPYLIPSAHKKIVVHSKKCIGCGACTTVCPANCINKKYRVLEINVANCIYCGLCGEVCPEKAIALTPGNELPSFNKEHLCHELRIKLKRCEFCREIIGTKKGVLKTVKDLFSKRGINTRELEWVNLCSSCRRKFQSYSLIRQRIK